MQYFKTAKVIVSRVYRHKTLNRTASIYGASPWSGAPGDTENDWEMVTRGYALECTDSRGQMTIQGLQYAPYRLDTAEDALRHGLKIADVVTDTTGIQHRS